MGYLGPAPAQTITKATEIEDGVIENRHVKSRSIQRNKLDDLEVGTIVFRPAENPGLDEVVADGSTLLKADYPELWDFVLFTATLGSGDGQFESLNADEFRVPDLVGGAEFIRAGDGLEIGVSQGDAIRNITGRFGDSGASGYTGFQGAFSGSGSASRYDFTDVSAGNLYSHFDASTQVPTDTENRPRNITYLPCIKTGRINN